MCARVWNSCGFGLWCGAGCESVGLTDGGSMSPNRKDNKINGLGVARVTGGAPASASIPPIIF